MSDKLKVGMIALGCEKNRIDAEIMLAKLEKEGYELCGDKDECDAVIINTCTFIDKAKEESIENILATAEMKKNKLKKLIVTGCLAERYREEIMKEIPEVDAVLGSKSFDSICEAIREISDGRKYTRFTPLTEATPCGDRIVTTPPYSVYLKLADGCSNHCSYCVIPSVRGEFSPRAEDEVFAEAEKLAEDGAVEINLIAQDTTAYPTLCRLIKRIAGIEKVRWIRILYCRPEEITDELIDLFSTEEKLVNYIDVPLQHASGTVLRLMNRSMDDRTLLELIAKLRERIPGVSLRTTFISGFPKETEKDHEILCEFVKKARFNNLGVFTYSAEEGTKAGRMHGQIPDEIKLSRADNIMQLQSEMIAGINSQYVSGVYEILCEGFDPELQLFTGRAYFQAPDIDGRVFFATDKPVPEGTFASVKIDRAEGYDLFGHTI